MYDIIRYMNNIEHIGIAVKSLEISIPVFESLLNTTCYKTEKVTLENVATAFFKTGETKIELLQDEIENGVISKFIAKKGEGIHHIAFEVKDIRKEMIRLREAGFDVLNGKGFVFRNPNASRTCGYIAKPR